MYNWHTVISSESCEKQCKQFALMVKYVVAECSKKLFSQNSANYSEAFVKKEILSSVLKLRICEDRRLID